MCAPITANTHAEVLEQLLPLDDFKSTAFALATVSAAAEAHLELGNPQAASALIADAYLDDAHSWAALPVATCAHQLTESKNVDKRDLSPGIVLDIYAKHFGTDLLNYRSYA
jgi:hypothetical protein